MKKMLNEDKIEVNIVKKTKWFGKRDDPERKINGIKTDKNKSHLNSFLYFKNRIIPVKDKIKIKIVNCPKCNFYPMIKIKTKYICEMCGYVLKKIVRKKRKLNKEV